MLVTKNAKRRNKSDFYRDQEWCGGRGKGPGGSTRLLCGGIRVLAGEGLSEEAKATAAGRRTHQHVATMQGVGGAGKTEPLERGQKFPPDLLGGEASFQSGKSRRVPTREQLEGEGFVGKTWEGTKLLCLENVCRWRPLT